jgi:hypothetical protein
MVTTSQSPNQPEAESAWFPICALLCRYLTEPEGEPTYGSELEWPSCREARPRIAVPRLPSYGQDCGLLGCERPIAASSSIARPPPQQETR